MASPIGVSKRAGIRTLCRVYDALGCPNPCSRVSENSSRHGPGLVFATGLRLIAVCRDCQTVASQEPDKLSCNISAGRSTTTSKAHGAKRSAQRSLGIE